MDFRVLHAPPHKLPSIYHVEDLLARSEPEVGDRISRHTTTDLTAIRVARNSGTMLCTPRYVLRRGLPLNSIAAHFASERATELAQPSLSITHCIIFTTNESFYDSFWTFGLSRFSVTLFEVLCA